MNFITEGGGIPSYRSGSVSKCANVITQFFQNYNILSVNELNKLKLQSEGISVEDARTQWPLRSEKSQNFFDFGVKITVVFNATTYYEVLSSEGNYDIIRLVVSGIDNDRESSALELPYYEMMPCERLVLVLKLEHHKSLNRPSDPCRNDYPSYIESFLAQPIADYLRNPVFAPHLPYDRETCIEICETKHLLPICGCMYGNNAWHYAGSPPKISICAEEHRTANCTFTTPDQVIKACLCYPRCEQYRFQVVAQQTLKFNYGTYCNTGMCYVVVDC